MSEVWQAQEAMTRFSELLETSLAEGPQIVTGPGVEKSVLVPIEHWRRLQRITRPKARSRERSPGGVALSAWEPHSLQ
ncbi:MAG: type II toxin-antitoxin system Phd/YefM family antitoxin [Chloroflexota bacterium]|nr:type II toxin-antitoxin system Phd/YefM family antitoxin [Chloroflexota bacterium]MDE2920970.1 type II toxin-antitoxin system Phd/YefM family antitoxin [Chloroflexota bacterium]